MTSLARRSAALAVAVALAGMTACTATTAGSAGAPGPGSRPSTPGTGSPEGPAPGATSAGDGFFPREGNGGYDVLHYRLRVAYDPSADSIHGYAVVTARATQALSRFSLDLRRWLAVSSASVDGRPAEVAQPAALVQKLVVTPARPLAAGATFRVAVRYAGPGRAIGESVGFRTGWITTPDGAFVANEPDGASAWFPANDTPDDKATYAITVVVPRGLVGMSNGALVSVRRSRDTTAWAWRLTTPVSTYLVTATLGRFQMWTGRTPSGIPYRIAVDPALLPAARPVLARLPDIVDFFSAKFGRYPFDQTGAIVDNHSSVGYELETATRPEFDRVPSEQVLAHELAHQWFGDDVTLARWRDIWLNEGFAEFGAWLWDEHRGIESAAEHLRRLLRAPASAPVWRPPPGDPGSAARTFAYSVYERGAGTLEALRQKVGDRVFFGILRGWAAAHRYGNATVSDFTAFASQRAGVDLGPLFRRWLYRRGKP